MLAEDPDSVLGSVGENTSGPKEAVIEWEDDGNYHNATTYNLVDISFANCTSMDFAFRIYAEIEYTIPMMPYEDTVTTPDLYFVILINDDLNECFMEGLR